MCCMNSCGYLATVGLPPEVWNNATNPNRQELAGSKTLQCLGLGKVLLGGFCDSNKDSGSIKVGRSTDRLSDCQLPKNSVLCNYLEAPVLLTERVHDDAQFHASTKPLQKFMFFCKLRTVS